MKEMSHNHFLMSWDYHIRCAFYIKYYILYVTEYPCHTIVASLGGGGGGVLVYGAGEVGNNFES